MFFVTFAKVWLYIGVHNNYYTLRGIYLCKMR